MSHDLILTRNLQAPPEALYRCWTEASLLKRFFAPTPGETVEAVIEPVPGGRFYTRMRFEEHGDIEGEGCVLIADPGRRLVFTDVLSENFRPTSAGFFTADINFEPASEGCLYRVIARHADAQRARKHAEMGFETGWGTVAEQLEAVARAL